MLENEMRTLDWIAAVHHDGLHETPIAFAVAQRIDVREVDGREPRDGSHTDSTSLQTNDFGHDASIGGPSAPTRGSARMTL
jgi:hypothetical protein